MLADVEIVGLVFGGFRLPNVWRSDAEFEVVRTGGEAPPSADEVEFVAIPVSSVLESVLWLLFFVKLALERRRSSFKKAGAIGHLWQTSVVLLVR